MHFLKKAMLLTLIFSSIFAESNSLRMGDHLMKRGDFMEAHKEYSKALEADRENPNILWRVGSALTQMAQSETSNLRHDYLEQATNYINRAIVENSEIIEAHLEYARALGYLALFKPDWDDFRVARRVREELAIVLEKEPDNSEANFLLGTWHRWVGPVPPLKRNPNDLWSACVDSSLYYFRKASKLDPDNLLYKLEISRTYVYIDSEDKARAGFNEIIHIKDINQKYLNIVDQAKRELEKLDNLEGK